MKISVAIPTYNRRDLIARTLPTVLEQDLAAGEYEVVVVVDGSSDGTAEFLRGVKAPCPLRVLEQPNRGPAAARNAAIAAARGELVLFLDDDIRCDQTLVRKHIAAHQGADPCVVFGPVHIAPESLPGLSTDLARAWYEAYAARLRRDGRPSSEYDVWVYSNCSVPRAVLLEHGGYDEQFRIYEDAECAIRLWTAGVRFRFEPDAPVYQVYSKTAAHLVQTDAPRTGAGEIHLCRKQPGFRGHSRVAGLVGGSRKKLPLAWLSCTGPLPLEPLLRVPFRIAERLSKIPTMRRVGISLLNYRMGVAALRSAMSEVGSWQALRREFGVRLPVLAYHHVGPRHPGTNTEFSVSPEQFERQVRWLARHGYVGIRPSDWFKWRREGKPLPQKPVLITLDDGYADIAEYALPVVRRHGFSAGVYVVTGQLGGSKNWGEAWGPEMSRLLSAEQLLYWASEGIEFGAHSRTHADLTTLGGDQLGKEVEGSRDDLCRILRTRPTSFAYPYGAYNGAVRACVQRSFDLALSCEEGSNGLTTDAHSLHRTEVLSGDNIVDFACRVRLGWVPTRHLRRRLRVRTRAAAAVRGLRTAVRF